MNIKAQTIGKRDAVKNYVLNYILRNELKPGDRILTQQMIADDLQVNQLTVSKALNDLVEENIIYRIQGKGTFVAEKNKSSDLMSNIALVLPDDDMLNAEKHPNNWHLWSEILPAFSKVIGASKKMSHVIIDRNLPAEKRIAELENFDAVFIPSDREYMPLVEKLTERQNVSVIVLGNKMKNLNCLHIWVSPFESMKNGVENLIYHGFRKIAYGGTTDTPEKISGFIAGLEEGGIEIRQELIYKNILNILDVPKIADDILNGIIDCDAVIMDNDIKAVQLIDTLRSNGKRVPEDISVMGFDGIKAYTQGPPFLATVNTSYEEVIQTAISLLDSGNMKSRQFIQIVGYVQKGITVKRRK